MQPIVTVTGYLGASIQIFDNKVIISKKGLSGIATGGAANGKEIWMKSITGIQLKNPSFIKNGEFSIISTGTNSNSTKDENTIFFRKNQMPDFMKAKEIIEQLANK